MDRTHDAVDRVHAAGHESTEPSLNAVRGFDDLRPKLKITEGVSKI
jgi:hypothetical protein